ncbi:MAG: FtsW/RodA/SpoVE family cell cycle protein, partial [Bacteroidota bacterium]
MTNIRELSWSVVLAWLGLATFGLLAIYSATQGPVSQFLPGYIQSNFIKQSAWVVLSIVIMIGIQFVSPRTFIQVSYLAYGLGILLMIATLLIGTEVNGARSWLQIGPARFQTSEFMKILTILATANYLTSRRDISAENIRYALIAVVLVLVPAVLVVLQNDFGTSIVYFSLIPVMLFWSGLPYGVSLFIISPAIVGYLSIIEWYYGA